MSLDTKYRPLTFDDVLGQEAIIAILRRYIATGRSLHQSYLFAGPWGSGKTTLGRIMARALMCSTPKESGDPCDTCPSCVSILETGASLDFVEVDAATNSGKADVQKIIEEIQYSTFSGRRRIYLFDESHQLSKDALDALLKPLEETLPGTQEKKLVCIFCTTEPEKMKATIFSRCAPTFVIQPVSPPIIAKRLAHICDVEGFEYDPEMLQVIAEITECHIRDALKAIEGVSMMGSLDRENVTKYLRLDSNLMYLEILEKLGNDLAGAMGILKTALEKASPATCYEKLAQMAMLAYQVGLGAVKSPSYIEASRLQGLYKGQQHNLLGYANRFSSRPGRPTEAMLLCDLGSLHHGEVFVAREERTQQSRAVVQASPTAQSPGNVLVAPLPTPTGTLSIAPPAQKAEVRVDQKAVRNLASEAVEVTNGKVPQMNPSDFSRLLAMQIVSFEGSVGSTGRTDMDRR